MKTVILAGGLGTRLREETEFRPKPMIEIGGMPILWHIMKIYAHFGFTKFLIPVGYKGHAIKSFFQNYHLGRKDLVFSGGKLVEDSLLNQLENWDVHLRDTGLLTNTGGRIFALRDLLDSEDSFFCTYGDGLADVNLHSLLDFHKRMGRIATVTAVVPVSRFGQLTINNSEIVTEFKEKPITEARISGGFFVFSRKIFEFLSDDCILESQVLESLANKGEIAAFKHDGFWKPMDTYRETLELNSLWNNGNAPWHLWE